MSAAERKYSDPQVTLESGAYWQAAKEGRLLVRRCRACSRIHWYPRAVCPHCFSGDTEWLPARGHGHIYSFSVMRRADPPYVIAYVTLEEGVTMMTNLVECDFDALAIGQPVEVMFRDTEGGWKLPVFRPRR